MNFFSTAVWLHRMDAFEGTSIEAIGLRLELTRTVFRSDHASNWLVLKGVLGAEKDRLLQQIQKAIHSPDAASLRHDWERGL